MEDDFSKQPFFRLITTVNKALPSIPPVPRQAKYGTTFLSTKGNGSLACRTQHGSCKRQVDLRQLQYHPPGNQSEASPRCWSPRRATARGGADESYHGDFTTIHRCLPRLQFSFSRPRKSPKESCQQTLAHIQPCSSPLPISNLE